MYRDTSSVDCAPQKVHKKVHLLVTLPLTQDALHSKIYYRQIHKSISDF